MDTTQLKTCPFCGGIPTASSTNGTDFMIGCGHDGCWVYVVVGPCETADEAAKAWNDRAGEKS